MSLRIEHVTDLRGFGLVSYLRTAVYILEQDCPPVEEFDALDNTASHYLGWAGDEPVACCRSYQDAPGVFKIGRIVTAQAQRGNGYASAMLTDVIGRIKAEPGAAEIKMSAQEHAIGLYEKLGFVPYGETYLEAGLPHRMMKMEIDHD